MYKRWQKKLSKSLTKLFYVVLQNTRYWNVSHQMQKQYNQLNKDDKIELLYEYRMRLVNLMKNGLNNGNGTIVRVLKIFLHTR